MSIVLYRRVATDFKGEMLLKINLQNYTQQMNIESKKWIFDHLLLSLVNKSILV